MKDFCVFDWVELQTVQSPAGGLGVLLLRSVQFLASLFSCNNGETFRGNWPGQTWAEKACVGRQVGQLFFLVLLLKCQENWCVLLNSFILPHQHLLHKNVPLVHFLFIFELVVILISFRKWLYVLIVVVRDEGNYNESFIFTDEYVNWVVESNIV